MRKRLTMLATLVLAGAFLGLPTTAAAAEGYEYQVRYNHCDGADPRIKVKNIAYGNTNANKLDKRDLGRAAAGGQLHLDQDLHVAQGQVQVRDQRQQALAHVVADLGGRPDQLVPDRLPGARLAQLDALRIRGGLQRQVLTLTAM